MLNSIFLMIVSAVLVSCSQLVDDPAPAASESNYPTVEIHAGGMVFHGLGVVPIQYGNDYSTLNISVQGYYEGTIKVDSKDCDVHETRSYVDNELVRVPVFGPATRNCLFNFVLSPRYPKDESSGIKIHNFIGSLAVKVLDEDDKWSFRVLKATGNFKAVHSVEVNSDDEVELIMDKCGGPFHGFLNPSNKIVEIDLSVAIDKDTKNCVLEGLLVQENDFWKFTVPVSIYDKSFVPLAKPKLELETKDLKITADDVVSIISLDDKYKVKNEGSFKFDPNTNHIIRILTVKGRSVIGFYNSVIKKWILLQ